MPSDRSEEQHRLAVERTVEAKRRTHLANERTYAAWVRTALALIGLGVGITGYFHLVGSGRAHIYVIIGLVFVASGALMAGLATYAYRQTYLAIERGHYETAFAFTLLLGSIPILVGLLSLLLIVLS